MTQIIVVALGVLLLATSTVFAQPVQSAPYTGTPAGTSSGDILWSQLDEPTGEAFNRSGVRGFVRRLRQLGRR